MNDKKTRNLKVYGQSGYHYKETPTIILKGRWLQESGFEIGDQISVEIIDGQLVVRKRESN